MNLWPRGYEVWPLAADENGIWLLSGGDAWRTGPIPADSEPLFEVKLLVSEYDSRMKLDLIHSTSWRVDGPAVILTWIGIARADGLVIDQWPHALPVTHGAIRKGRQAYYARR